MALEYFLIIVLEIKHQLYLFSYENMMQPKMACQTLMFGSTCIFIIRWP